MSSGTPGTYTVEQVLTDEPRKWQSQKYGEQLSYELKLVGREAKVEYSQAPADPAPKADDVIEGTIYPSGNNYPDKLYKRRAGGGGGGGRNLSPEAQKRIDATGRAQGRAHAQEMALRWFALKATPPGGMDELTGAIDWFYDDAQGAKADGYRGS